MDNSITDKPVKISQPPQKTRRKSRRSQDEIMAAAFLKATF